MSGELDGFAAHAVAADPGVLVPKGTGQTCEQPRPQLDVIVGDGGQTLLEKRHELRIGSRAPPNDPPTVPGGRSS